MLPLRCSGWWSGDAPPAVLIRRWVVGDYVLDLSFGQASCTAMETTTVRRKPPSWGCSGQTMLVKSSFQAQKPTNVPIKLATSVIFQAGMGVMNVPYVLYTTEVPGLFRRLR